MEAMEMTGAWWVPSKGQSKAPGILTFSEEEGLRLKVSKPLGSYRQKIILGSVGGKPVTLHDCYETRSSSRGFSIISQEFSVDTGFLGISATQPAQVRFRKAVFDFTDLIDWAAVTGMQMKISSKGYTLKYRRPDDININLPDGTLKLGLSGAYPLGASPETTVRESASWELITRKGKRIEDLLSAYITPLWNLLRLASMRENTIEKFTVYRKPSDRPGQAIQVIFKTGYNPRKVRALSRPEMLFSLAQIRDIGSDVLRQWLQIHSKITAVIDNLVGPPSGSKIRLTRRFLDLAQAAEVYHRLFFSPQTDIPEKEHQERMDEILSTAPAAHRQWLKEKLTYSNEPSLRRRLRGLLAEANTIMSPIFPDNKKRRIFIQKVVSIRNELTHRLNTAATRPEDLFCLSEILFFLVSACLLIRAGLPKRRLVKFFRNNYRYGRCADYSLS